MTSVDLPTSHVFARSDARKVQASIVRSLVESIREVGIINPLRVRPCRRYVQGTLADAWEVTAGHHRLNAALEIGLEAVPCLVVDDDDLRAELVMIDENLCRAELDAAQRAKQTARRKAIYEELHPETRNGATGGGHNQLRQLGEPAPRFTSDTAVATGKSERAIQRDAERGEKISSEVLDKVAGTDLDTGSYLDKLKNVEPEKQAAKVEKDLAAVREAKRKPISPPAAIRNEFELVNKEHAVLIRAWEAARPEARERFLADIGAVIDTPAMDVRAA